MVYSNKQYLVRKKGRTIDYVYIKKGSKLTKVKNGYKVKGGAIFKGYSKVSAKNWQGAIAIIL